MSKGIMFIKTYKDYFVTIGFILVIFALMMLSSFAKSNWEADQNQAIVELQQEVEQLKKQGCICED
jgi:hypothetical protein